MNHPKRQKRKCLSKGLIASSFRLITFCTLVVSVQVEAAARGAHDMPYTRYDSEVAKPGNGAESRQASQFDQSQIASEASNQHYINLPSAGSFVEWKVATTGDGVTLRFTLPDSANGTGLKGNMSLTIRPVERPECVLTRCTSLREGLNNPMYFQATSVS